ncbi:tripartite tricarboxylate transporter TctB family protein [Ottowia oryzae]
MIDRNLARGVFLAAVALAFGVYSLRYPVGSWDRAGSGLFPLMVSGALLAMALMIIVRSRFQKPEPLEFNVKNISLLLVSLCVFALLSLYVNMVVAIVAMVFIAGNAAATYSVSRNVKISLGLIVVAFAFQKFLGLSLPLL